jgi:hypothetical protein
VDDDDDNRFVKCTYAKNALFFNTKHLLYRMESEEGKGKGKKKQDRCNKKMSMCERKEHVIKKMKKCIMDKMEWVDEDGMANMEKIQSSYTGTKIEDMFMKKGDKTINKCAEIADKVEEKLMKIMNVEMCQKNLGAKKESSEEDFSLSEEKDALRSYSRVKKTKKKKKSQWQGNGKRRPSKSAKKAWASESLRQGKENRKGCGVDKVSAIKDSSSPKEMKDTYIMDQDLVKEMMKMSKDDFLKQVLLTCHQLGLHQ